MKCRVKDCEGRVEANAEIWFSFDDGAGWSVYGVGDEAARIVCDDAGHENHTEWLDKSLSAFIEELLPGKTWEGGRVREIHE